jgi:hypothetical protein
VLCRVQLQSFDTKEVCSMLLLAGPEVLMKVTLTVLLLTQSRTCFVQRIWGVAISNSHSSQAL